MAKKTNPKNVEAPASETVSNTPEESQPRESLTEQAGRAIQKDQDAEVEKLKTALNVVAAEGKSSTEVINKLAQVDAAYSASIDDLTDAVKRAGAATADAGVAIGDALTKITGAPTVFERDERGLVKGLQYHYLPDGKVDWRKMIDPKYIVLRKENKDEIEKVYGKPFDEIKVEDVDDKYLLLLLGGVKDLLKLRGFLDVHYKPIVATPEFVSMLCEIDFIPNFESSGAIETFSDGADATPDNVEGWYAKYLTTAALNRAFVRAVRNYLGIYIVGKDEIGPGSKTEESSRKTTGGVDGFGPYAMLADLLKKRDRTFDQLKKFLVSKNFGEENGLDLATLEKLEDIPKDKIFKVVGLIKAT